MTDAELAEIEARAEAATPGPWRASTGRTHDPCTGRVTSVEYWISRGDDDVGITGDVSDSRTGKPSIANAAFLAHARTDVPALIAEVRRLRAEVERLNGRLGVLEESVLMAEGADYDESLRDCLFCGEDWQEHGHELRCPRWMAEVIRRERKGRE